jgi:hypothetical protein
MMTREMNLQMMLYIINILIAAGWIRTTSLAFRRPSDLMVRGTLCAAFSGRKDVVLPLLDLSDSEIADRVVIPLPSAHLPDELTTLNLYGMELTRPIHKMIMDDAIQMKDGTSSSTSPSRSFGQIVIKKNLSENIPQNAHPLVGAVGCSGEVLIQAARRDVISASEIGQDAPIVVLYRGCFRFVVKDIVKSIPYPVAIVDEIVDDDHQDDDPWIGEPTNRIISQNSKDEEDVDDDKEGDDIFDEYSSLSIGELNQRIMRGLKVMIDQKRQDAENSQASILEQSILENANVAVPDTASLKEQVEEAAVVFAVFSTSLSDFAPTRHEQSYAIAMMAAEIASFDNKLRAKMLAMTNSLNRLRLVCQQVEESVKMRQAHEVAASIISQKDEGSKDLKVGPPKLPPWANQIKKGTRIEYYWNEQWEWSPGVVIDEPIKIMDEILLKVQFDADGEIHTLPLNPDEKLRWRPGNIR